MRRNEDKTSNKILHTNTINVKWRCRVSGAQARGYKANARTSLRHAGLDHTETMNADRSSCLFVFLVFSFVLITSPATQLARQQLTDLCRRMFSLSVARVVIVHNPRSFF